MELELEVGKFSGPKWTAAALVILFTLSLAFYFLGLGKLPLEDADEATYASVVRSMRTSGNYSVLSLEGKPWFEKPPLLFWLAALSVKVFGFSEFSLRLPSAVAGLVTVLLVMLLAVKITGSNEAGFVGGLIILFFPLFLAGARNFRMDVPVVMSMLAALYFFIRGMDNRKSSIGFGIFLAAGFLFKSIIGFLSVPVVIIFSFINKKWSWFKNPFFWLGNALGFLILLPWHAYQFSKFGMEFFRVYLGFHVAERFAGNIIGSGITSGYILWVFWRYGQPWLIIFLFSFLLYLFRSKIKSSSLFSKETCTAASWVFWTCLFIAGLFMVSRTKLVPYFIPVYPWVAIFISIVYSALILQSGKVRIAARAIMLLALTIGAILTYNEVFLNPKLYITRAAGEEKIIGQILRGKPDFPVIIYEYPSDQTIKYYSERKVLHLTAENAEQLVPPFYIIIPSELLEQNEWLKSLPNLFGGKSLSLYEAVE